MRGADALWEPAVHTEHLKKFDGFVGVLETRSVKVEGMEGGEMTVTLSP